MAQHVTITITDDERPNFYAEMEADLAADGWSFTPTPDGYLLFQLREAGRDEGEKAEEFPAAFVQDGGALTYKPGQLPTVPDGGKCNGGCCA